MNEVESILVAPRMNISPVRCGCNKVLSHAGQKCLVIVQACDGVWQWLAGGICGQGERKEIS